MLCYILKYIYTFPLYLSFWLPGPCDARFPARPCSTARWSVVCCFDRPVLRDGSVGHFLPFLAVVVLPFLASFCLDMRVDTHCGGVVVWVIRWLGLGCILFLEGLALAVVWLMLLPWALYSVMWSGSDFGDCLEFLVKGENALKILWLFELRSWITSLSPSWPPGQLSWPSPVLAQQSSLLRSLQQISSGSEFQSFVNWGKNDLLNLGLIYMEIVYNGYHYFWGCTTSFHDQIYRIE